MEHLLKRLQYENRHEHVALVKSCDRGALPYNRGVKEKQVTKVLRFR